MSNHPSRHSEVSRIAATLTPSEVCQRLISITRLDDNEAFDGQEPSRHSSHGRAIIDHENRSHACGYPL